MLTCFTEGPLQGRSSESSNASSPTRITLKLLLVQQMLAFTEGPQLVLKGKGCIHPGRLGEDYSNHVHANNWDAALCIKDFVQT